MTSNFTDPVGRQPLVSDRAHAGRPRVLQLSLTLDLGGVEEVLRIMTHYLDRGCHDTRVFTFGPGRVSAQIEQDGIRVISLDIGRQGGIRRQWTKVWALYRVLKEERIDLVHNHNCLQLFPLLLLRRIFGRPFAAVLSVHQFAEWRGLQGWLYARWVNAHDRVLPVSNPVREHLAVRYGVPREKCVVLHNTVEPHPITISREEARRKLGVPAEAFVISHVGRLVSNKHVDDLIEAVARLAPQCPLIRVLVVGKGPEEARLRDKVAAECPDQVSILGYVDDLMDIYRASDVHVSTGSSETFSLVTLEAMSQQCIPIAYIPNGVVDVIDEGRTGFLIPARDVTLLVERLDWIHSQPAAAAAMAEAGYQRYRERFFVSRHIERLQAIYQSVLGDSSPGSPPQHDIP